MDITNEHRHFIDSLWQDLRRYGYYLSATSMNTRRRSNIYKNRCRHRILSNEEFNTLANYAQQGCQEAWDLAVIYSTRLVCKVASRHKTKHSANYPTGRLDDDLVQSGFLGVLKSIPNWKQERGHFTSYATYRIRAYIQSAVRDTDDIIKIKSGEYRDLLTKIPYLSLMYESQCDQERLPYNLDGFRDWLNANGHISKRIKKGVISNDDLLPLLNTNAFDSLDRQITPYFQGDNTIRTTLIDTVMDNSQNDPLDASVNADCSERLREFYKKALDILTPKQRQVIIVYYNLSEDAAPSGITVDLTLKQVADILNRKYRRKNERKWSVANCQELHARAMSQIRSYVKQEGISYEEFAKM